MFARTSNVSGLVNIILNNLGEDNPFYGDIRKTMKSFKTHTIKSIKACFDLLADRHSLAYLCLDMLGINGAVLHCGALWSNPNWEFFFLHETFDAFNLQEAIAPLGKIKKLRISHVYGLETMEHMARAMDVEELEVFGSAGGHWEWFRAESQGHG